MICQKLLTVAASAAIALSLLAVPSAAQENSNGESAATLQKLRDAQVAYQQNSTAYTADNPTLDHYYDHKAAEVDSLINRIQAGEKVSPKEISAALNSSYANSLSY